MRILFSISQRWRSRREVVGSRPSEKPILFLSQLSARSRAVSALQPCSGSRLACLHSLQCARIGRSRRDGRVLGVESIDPLIFLRSLGQSGGTQRRRRRGKKERRRNFLNSLARVLQSLACGQRLKARRASQFCRQDRGKATMTISRSPGGVEGGGGRVRKEEEEGETLPRLTRTFSLARSRAENGMLRARRASFSAGNGEMMIKSLVRRRRGSRSRSKKEEEETQNSLALFPQHHTTKQPTDRVRVGAAAPEPREAARRVRGGR